jgi:hypothetical protein
VAEHQFRLACTVNLAVANRAQTLDVPVEWVFGRHRVIYLDFGLRWDQAEWAAAQLEMTATCVLAGAIRDVIVEAFKNPKRDDNRDVVNAYQISRMIRKTFSDTCNLHDKPLDWHDYGGPLVMSQFGRFV